MGFFSSCANAKQVTAMDLIVSGLCKQEFFEAPSSNAIVLPLTASINLLYLITRLIPQSALHLVHPQ